MSVGSAHAPVAGPPVVLVPGLNNSAAVWRDVQGALPDDIVTVAVDCPALPDVDAIADALLADLPERFVAVGHSFGGYVALAMLALAPQRVAGLVLVNSSDAADTPQQAVARRTRAAEMRDEDYEAAAMALAARAYHPNHAGDERLLAQRRRGVREYGADRYRAHLLASAARPDRGAVLAAATVPVLVLTADHDEAIAPEEQIAMARRVGARQHTVAGTGHMLPAEDPGAVARQISAFVEGVARA